MKIITKAGFHFGNCYVTNAVKCQDRNEEPVELEMIACNYYLKEEIKAIKPKVVVALGNIAGKAVYYALVKLRMIGDVEVRKFYHPSYILRFGTKEVEEAYQKQFYELFAEVK